MLIVSHIHYLIMKNIRFKPSSNNIIVVKKHVGKIRRHHPCGDTINISRYTSAGDFFINVGIETDVGFGIMIIFYFI